MDLDVFVTFILKTRARSGTSYSCLYCESVPGRVLPLFPLVCRVSFLFPGATVFSTGLNLLFTGLDMAAWPGRKHRSFGHYSHETFLHKVFPSKPEDLCLVFYVQKSRCSPHRERWVVPGCNLAAEANVTRLQRCRRTCCIFNGWKCTLCCEGSSQRFASFTLKMSAESFFWLHGFLGTRKRKENWGKNDVPRFLFKGEKSVNVVRSLSNGETVFGRTKRVGRSSETRHETRLMNMGTNNFCPPVLPFWHQSLPNIISSKYQLASSAF